MAMKMLVAIADFGGSNTLEKVKGCFLGHTVVVFSTVKGEYVYPATIGEGLPFAHREFFEQERNNYDYFFYTENDLYFTHLTLGTLIKFFDMFGKDNPLGLIRSEQTQLIDFGAVTDRPKIKHRELGKFYAANDHQGCYMLSQYQLNKCIDSGNYNITPSARKGYGMLETGASNVYFECGLQKTYPVSYLERLLVDHMRPRWHDKQLPYKLDDLYRELDNTL